MSSAKWWAFCLSLNVLKGYQGIYIKPLIKTTKYKIQLESVKTLSVENTSSLYLFEMKNGLRDKNHKKMGEIIYEHVSFFFHYHLFLKHKDRQWLYNIINNGNTWHMNTFVNSLAPKRLNEIWGE